jgi:hypothetical protein
MISIDDAFLKFKSRLELNENEQRDASRRQNDLRDNLRDSIAINRDFLTGSYKRFTKTKPLKDVDVFCVLNEEKEGHFLKTPSRNLLEHFRAILSEKYGKENVLIGRRSVTVSFGVKDTESDDKVMSIDVVPAFEIKEGYKIPDPLSKDDWTKTDPEIHTEKATAANKAFNEQWKPLVKMIKKWNEFHGKPIKPSFLIEVMALEILYPPFKGGYEYELKSFFWTAKERIRDVWEDPAGLGQPVSDQMDETKCVQAEKELILAGKNAERAILLNKNGNTGEALRVWRENIFGEFFPLS